MALAFDLTRSLDATDWSILRELQDDARISWSELGRRVSLSPPAVADRVRRLEDAGIISGYRAAIGLPAAGYSITAFIRIAVKDAYERTYERFEQHLAAAPEILECHHLTGDDCFIAKVAATSVEHLEQVIRELSRFGRTTTSIVLSTPVSRRVIEPAAV